MGSLFFMSEFTVMRLVFYGDGLNRAYPGGFFTVAAAAIADDMSLSVILHLDGLRADLYAGFATFACFRINGDFHDFLLIGLIQDAWL